MQSGNIEAEWIEGKGNVADIGTKPLRRLRLYGLMHLGGMRRLDSKGSPEGSTEVKKLTRAASLTE